jgi:hypothetical protein
VSGRVADGPVAPHTRLMGTENPVPAEDRDVAPLGATTSDPPGDDGADGMAGPVYPPPETEPDAGGGKQG